jgi:heat shock protein HslJ
MKIINTIIKMMSLLLVSLFGLNACVATNANYGNGSSYNDTYRPKPAATSGFSTENWTLTSINNSPYQGRRVTLNISTTNKVNGFSGCNRYFVSDINVSGNQLRFGSVGSTKKFCVDQNSNNLEQRYLSALQDVSHFQRGNNRLVLNGRSGNLVFHKSSTR